MANIHNLLSSKGLVGHVLKTSFLLDALCFCRGLDDVQSNKYDARAKVGLQRPRGHALTSSFLFNALCFCRHDFFIPCAVFLSWPG